MLDIAKVGTLIAYLRKAKDLTQVELANSLNVSHQAVSKWERGESMPDIGTLPMLAHELGVTTDDLLQGQVEEHRQVAQLHMFVASLADANSNKAGEMIVSQQVTAQDLSDLGPIIKTSTMRELAPCLLKTHLTITDAIRLAPFLDDDVLERILRYTEPTNWTWDELHKVAPFVRRPLLAEWAVAIADSTPPSRRHVISLAPFLERSLLDALVIQIEEGGWSWNTLIEIVPFVSRESLVILVQGVRTDKRPNRHVVMTLAPFLDRETVDHLAIDVNVESWDWGSLKSIAPFVSKTILSNIVSHVMMTTPDAYQLVDIVPFLDRSELSRLIETAVK